VSLRQLTVNLEEPRRAHRQASALEAREDVAREAALNGVGLEQDERPLHGHGGRV